ncbi:hypothetical protein [Oceanihabitans sediminis]|uniref:hypothetical protein n=1 Tax=Oceanihabitans sediminis TaxID=1812012 RepID=UPI00299F29BB|nr:hypothetical protein [Oceanihabitans sediminis]MDX1278226.1 hypothetical protein [Oceanihabitans sediminis]MDX1773731.1 hypothetical protein [Oceanihabitans sediminis]
MMNIILIAVAVILLTIGLVWLVDKFIPNKLRPVLMIALITLIAFLGYQTFNSIYEPIKFNKVKQKRYAAVIEKMIDVRDSQLAHRQVTGTFAPNFENLIKFIDTAEFTITQRRVETVLDEEATKLYGGVETFKDITVIDTLGTVPVKDSLFKKSNRYKTMMEIPSIEGAKIEMKSGFIGEEGKPKIPVFEAKILKNVILADQDKDLVAQENEVVSVDGVNGNAIKVGSLDQVNTSGNWPKTYGDSE